MMIVSKATMMVQLEEERGQVFPFSIVERKRKDLTPLFCFLFVPLSAFEVSKIRSHPLFFCKERKFI
jgi:hypothetical protein